MARPDRSSWLTEIWTALATTSGIGYLATAYAVSRWLTRPSPSVPRRCAGINGELIWEDLQCRTQDGVLLCGWTASPEEPRATVALFHGLHRNRGDMMGRIALLTGAGYRCLAFDHRAHGESQGRLTSFGFYESADVQAVCQLIRQRWPAQPRAALGVSMGAAALCYAADEGDWNAVVLESPYHDLSSAFQTRVGSNYPLWFRRFSRGVVWVTERRLRLRLGDLAPIRYIHRFASSPLMLLTGNDDPHAPPEDVRKLFESCRGEREFIVIPGVDHTDLCDAGGTAYGRHILDFLDHHLPG